MKRSYSFDERKQILSVLQAANENPSLSNLSKKERVLLAAGNEHPPALSTIYRWQREGLTEGQLEENLGRRGRRTKLSPECTQLLLG